MTLRKALDTRCAMCNPLNMTCDKGCDEGFEFPSDECHVGHGRWDTDKVCHGYIPAYLEIQERIGTATAVCEIGVRNGGSLIMWQELYPEAKIVGVDFDIRAKWPPGTIAVLAHQNEPKLAGFLGDISPEYDLIVEDASHVSGLSFATWKLLWPLVKPGGYYVIEDWAIGFPNSEWFTYLGDGWLQLARSFVERFSCPAPMGIVSAEYRYGQIILRKYKEWQT